MCGGNSELGIDNMGWLIYRYAAHMLALCVAATNALNL